MAKKSRKQNTNAHKSKQELKHQLWMLRVKVGVIYIIIWVVAMGWVTRNLPDPASAQRFYDDSKAHWFMNIGLLVMFFVIQYYLGRKDDEEEVESSDNAKDAKPQSSTSS